MKNQKERLNKQSHLPSHQRVKYLGINLLKETKDLYSENGKMLIIEIETNTKRWKNIPSSWDGKINIVKIPMLPNAVYRFSAIPSKLPMADFIELERKSS